jgi:hypothetical protein
VQTLKVTRSLVQSVMAGIGPSSLAASFRRLFKVGSPATAYRVADSVAVEKTLRVRLCLSVVCILALCFVHQERLQSVTGSVQAAASPETNRWFFFK